MFRSAFAIAWREIYHNKLRSGLTTLGIVIGVAAVITLVTLGNGATARVTDDISSLGTNLLVLVPGQDQRNGPPIPAPAFKQSDIDAIATQIRGVTSVAPAATQGANAVYGNESYPSSIMGTTNEYLVTRNYELETGRSFTPGELSAGKPVCMIGATIREELFGLQTPIGAKIRLGTISCEVVGLLKSKGGTAFGGDQDDFILAPLRMVQRRLAGNRDINFVFLSVAEEAETVRVQDDLKRLLRERRHVPANQEDDFIVRDMKEITSIIETTTGILTAFLGAIAAISLIVGGIGIMNIMLVSVTERTREIGIRLAVGALERDVLVQFLIEATLLSVLGGAVGAALGLALSLGATIALDIPFIVSWPVVLLALGFSAFVGIVFGYFPARRAARLDPIDALRYE